MNIAKSIGYYMPRLDCSWRTFSEWLSLLPYELAAWYFDFGTCPPPLISYPPPRPDQVNLDWPQNAEAQEALEALRDNFYRFSVGGLMRLGRAISHGFVPGIDWDDSILSFRLGFLGSAIQDFEGKTENAFTRYWRDHWREIDLEWILFEIRAKL
ncbi:hypothetical protein A3I27_01675 [Candidatus Giovannonibacteria bacterium RIFCSPLOWO2_02_FULL_43_11b]|uniref:Uncharacterized protein n=1 Tax=Candidatus Giovannonibacteria bacterium RIFCSPHIGHO2_12_FULL_43_15 TaxID=1798341 RepID=A0A1F5WP49_9BACT|nr:MAG: hypothetical protein A3F23_03735 [Candidatus Giovannonibacteria bacterium RIFCSPHIGHO2_12_FULL_43_15]OGF89795.1 MAG: hypothetical protein A3I27_01675 [Candidatus Giovannonibacteria bacterium RIFCSPLOWO2_02_FULL_43_11b]OGF91993.1 MAG: hypothetical protein A3H04_04590 [Candidatus Giovannonibacteria bacterium RIFCSPLOWO2_12_FULL_43_11c]